MRSDLFKIYNQLKEKGITREKEKRILKEIDSNLTHSLIISNKEDLEKDKVYNLYSYSDLIFLQNFADLKIDISLKLKSLDELLEKDKQREKDGFPRKIKIGKLMKPGKGGKGKVIVIPTTTEEKFIHDSRVIDEEQNPSGGTGDGEEGEIIGQQPIRPEGGAGEGEAGEGEAGQHEMESNAYELGKILTDKFELPNLKDKGKKRSFSKYTYDLTDTHRGYGQILDKKATLKRVIKTNLSLNRISDINNIDPKNFLISPDDKIYRILSREKDYESQALVFFLRDYSGSMSGKPTELVVSQHILIYSWLLYQYSKQVETRFILHDTEAKEVPDFYTYYNSNVAGGTKVFSAFKLVNEIIKKENLEKDYNIYIFHGTDGDDWDTDGEQTIPQIKETLKFVNRIGITIVSGYSGETDMEKYLKKSDILKKNHSSIRVDTMKQDVSEKRIIEGIKKLTRE